MFCKINNLEINFFLMKKTFRLTQKQQKNETVLLHIFTNWEIDRYKKNSKFTQYDAYELLRRYLSPGCIFKPKRNNKIMVLGSNGRPQTKYFLSPCFIWIKVLQKTGLEKKRDTSEYVRGVMPDDFLVSLKARLKYC